MPKAKKAALKALELAPELAEAHAALAIVATCYDWDPEEAEKSFRRAIELNPNCVGAHLWIEIYLTFLEGKFGEAISELEQAQELDPLNMYVKARLGFMYLYIYDYDHAIELFQKIAELDPNFALVHLSLGTAYGWKGQLEKAQAELEMAMQLGGRAVAQPFDPVREDPRFKDLLKKMGLEAMLDKQSLIEKYNKSRSGNLKDDLPRMD